VPNKHIIIIINNIISIETVVLLNIFVETMTQIRFVLLIGITFGHHKENRTHTHTLNCNTFSHNSNKLSSLIAFV